MNWLVLSLKWSAGSDNLVWYKHAAQGYTTNLNAAGVFTEELAKSHQIDGVTLAVPESVARYRSHTVMLVPQDMLAEVVAKARGAA